MGSTWKSPVKSVGDEFNLMTTDYFPECEYFPLREVCGKLNGEDPKTLMKLKVEEKKIPKMAMPSKLPPLSAELNPIMESEIVNRDHPRSTEFNIVGDTIGWTNPEKSDSMPIVRYLFQVDGQAFESGVISHTLPLGKAEEWKITSKNGGHPYHIHVNPFQVKQFGDNSHSG